MTKLDTLKNLADAVDMETHPISFEENEAKFLAAANPQTILAMIALIRQQHEALTKHGSAYLGHLEDYSEAIAAFDAFNGETE